LGCVTVQLLLFSLYIGHEVLVSGVEPLAIWKKSQKDVGDKVVGPIIALGFFERRSLKLPVKPTSFFLVVCGPLSCEPSLHQALPTPCPCLVEGVLKKGFRDSFTSK
jgi:hypothetical protein